MLCTFFSLPIWFSSLLYNLIAVFTTLFSNNIASTKSNIGIQSIVCVLRLWIFVSCIFSVFIFVYYTVSVQITGDIFRSLTICLHVICLSAGLITHIALFCSLKMCFHLLPPQRTKLCVKWAWKTQIDTSYNMCMSHSLVIVWPLCSDVSS